MILNEQFDYKKLFSSVEIQNKNQATRVYLKQFLSSLENKNPLALATCADLSSSTNILIGEKTILEGGQSIPVGIREFAMGAIMNGMTLYSPSFKVIGGTFLAFSDYIKPAIRLGAMMKLPIIYAFTHDSYLIGGDGPTHQPYDQIPMLRAIENVNVYRPADEEELRTSLIEAYSSKKETSVIVLTRQNVPSLNINCSYDEIKKGAYVVKDETDPDYVLAASGSELKLALEIAQELNNVKVVSVPCLDKAINMSKAEINKLFSAKKMLVTMEASSDYK